MSCSTSRWSERRGTRGASSVRARRRWRGATSLPACGVRGASRSCARWRGTVSAGSAQRGACIRCILYTAVVMYTSTSPPLPTLSDVYVYALYTYTQICDHVCVRCMLFIQQKYINFERFQAGVTVNMTKKAYYGGHMLSRSVSAPYPTIYSPPYPL